MEINFNAHLVIIVSFFLILLVKASEATSLSPSPISTIVSGGQAELLLCKPDLRSYFEKGAEDDENASKLLQLAKACRRSYLSTGIAHIPNFISAEVAREMVKEATTLQKQSQCFYSSEEHTVYQEPQDLLGFARSHPRNSLQKSSKFIIDYDRIPKRNKSPLRALYSSPHLLAFVSYVVRPEDGADDCDDEATSQLFVSGCRYNAAYYNIYGLGDGLGWHFDRSDFGVNLELQTADNGGVFELCFGTRQTANQNDETKDAWCFGKVQSLLEGSSSSAPQRIQNPPVGPGSLVIFAGSLNIHRVTPVIQGRCKKRINAIMTYERQPNQKPNAYSLQKFFGR